jgi:hypothetical protein
MVESDIGELVESNDICNKAISALCALGTTSIVTGAAVSKISKELYETMSANPSIPYERLIDSIDLVDKVGLVAITSLTATAFFYAGYVAREFFKGNSRTSSEETDSSRNNAGYISNFYADDSDS